MNAVLCSGHRSGTVFYTLTFTRNGANTAYQINLTNGGLLYQNIVPSDTTLNGTVYPTLDALFTAFKTSVF